MKKLLLFIASMLMTVSLMAADLKTSEPMKLAETTIKGVALSAPVEEAPSLSQFEVPVVEAIKLSEKNIPDGIENAQRTGIRKVPAATIKISGLVDASTIADNAVIELVGNANLFMDVSKTFKCISGDYALTLSGGNTLTLSNAEGYAINVSSVTISCHLVVQASYVAIAATSDITINNSVNAKSTNTCIGTLHGTISINADVIATTSSSAAILNRGLENGGDIVINKGTVTATGGNTGIWAYGIAAGGNITAEAGTVIHASGGTGIYAEKGNIHLAGEVTANANGDDGSGVYAQAGEVSLSTISISSSGVGISAYNGLTLNGVTITNTADTGLGTVNGTLTINADVTATTAKSAAILNRGLENGGDIIINKGTITATGGNSGTWAYGIAAGGNINIKSGKVVAKGGLKGLFAEKGTISITPPLIVITAAGGGISADGHTVVYDNGDPALRVVIMDPPVAGVVSLNSAPTPGNAVGFTLSGEIASAQTDNVWQISDDDVTWQDIVESPAGAPALDGVHQQRRAVTTLTYTPKESEMGKYLRVKVAAANHTGYIYSPSRQIAKKICTDVPVVPTLTNINDKVYLSNAKTTQEYIIFNYSKEASSLTASDWNNAVTPESEVGFFELGGSSNANNTVFTRVKETPSTLASENVVEARLYIGTSVYLQDIELNISETVGYFQKAMSQQMVDF